jgi:allantoin racemase
MRIAWHICLNRGNYGRNENPEKLWTAMADYAVKVVNPGTQVELKFLNVSLDTFVHPYPLLINNVLLVEDVLKCQQEGFDAVMLGAAIDPSLDESRAAARIPVVGSLESAMAISQFIGRRVGIIGVRSAYITVIDQNVRRYGLQQRLVSSCPVRLWDLDYIPFMKALDGDGKDFINRIEEIGRDLIEEGADVLVTACQWFGAAFSRLGYSGISDKGVPIIECSAAGLKMAEAMVSLGHSIGLKKSESPFSPFRSMDPGMASQVATIRRS